MGQATNGFAKAHGKIYDGAKALNIRYGHSVFVGQDKFSVAENAG
jgi:hypothetical protein